ncbi:MAG: DEAD/DEAH box helicase [Myxococcales bacterium]|nr:DEAD/DEAH box helicase [Myxococcales bacterium]
MHTYRGLFGSHVGNVLRRLWRLCRHYGARPQVIACSATIAEPGALARALCPFADERGGFEVIDRDTSPAGPRRFYVVNPKVVDEITGVRRDYIKVTREITSILRRTGVSTLAFCRTRRAVELLTRYLRDDERHDHAGRGNEVAAGVAAHTAIRGYRGGYLPDRRREIERALREGEARVVASTNALELGVDIGGMDAVVLAGYPGTRAASWQRVGRAGRRGRPSLAVLVLSSSPLDQFVAASPEFLFDRAVEQARVDPGRVGHPLGGGQVGAVARLHVEVGAHPGPHLHAGLLPHQLQVAGGHGHGALAEEEAQVLGDVAHVEAGQAEELQLLVEPEAQGQVVAQRHHEVGPRGDAPLVGADLLGGAGLIEAQHHRVDGRAAAPQPLADPVVDAVELEPDEGRGADALARLGVVVGLLAQVVEAAVGEGGEVHVGTQAVVEASLVVPEADAHLVVDQREDRAGVAVAPGQRERPAGRAALAPGLLHRLAAVPSAPVGALTGGLALGSRGVLAIGVHLAAIEGDLEQAARVGQAGLDVAVDSVAARRAGAGLDDAAGVATQPHRGAAGVEVDRVDEVGVEHRGADGHVEEDRHAGAVEVVAGVARGRAAHHHVGQKAR